MHHIARQHQLLARRVHFDTHMAGRMAGGGIEGDLIVEKPGGWGWNKESNIPRVVIGPGSRVEGTIRLEREVKLYISESAEVGGVEGEMTMDDAVRFRGKRP